MYIGIFASYVLSFVFLVFALVVLWVSWFSSSFSDADRFPFLPESLRCVAKKSLEAMLNIAPDAAMFSA
jgi:hypothetical protein